MRALRLSSLALVLFVLAPACGDSEGRVTIVTGDAVDVFSRAPTPVTLVTETVALDGSKKELSRQALPTSSVDLGNLQPNDIGAIAITALGADGKALVKGQSLLVQWGALQSQTLQIFAQRTSELARVPQGPAAATVDTAVIVEGRFVFGVTGTSAFLYDLLQLRTLSGSPTLPQTGRSIAAFNSAALLIDENGATSFDLQTGASVPFVAPTGGTFDEIASGGRVGAPDAGQFIVGATRPLSTGGPTARVLNVDADGKASFASLVAPREAGCATYVEGRGLVVYGGGDAVATGGEVLAPNATVATPLPYPPDAIKGCAATALDSSHILIAGGDGGPARVLDLACTANCVLTAWPGALPIVRAEAASLGTDAALVLGDDAVGATHVYRVSAAEMHEVPLKNPRMHAHLLRAPADALIIVGGGAADLEMYRE